MFWLLTCYLTSITETFIFQDDVILWFILPTFIFEFPYEIPLLNVFYLYLPSLCLSLFKWRRIHFKILRINSCRFLNIHYFSLFTMSVFTTFFLLHNIRNHIITDKIRDSLCHFYLFIYLFIYFQLFIYSHVPTLFGFL
jgi:hypothetical protein